MECSTIAKGEASIILFLEQMCRSNSLPASVYLQSTQEGGMRKLFSFCITSWGEMSCWLTCIVFVVLSGCMTFHPRPIEPLRTLFDQGALLQPLRLHQAIVPA